MSYWKSVPSVVTNAKSVGAFISEKITNATTAQKIVLITVTVALLGVLAKTTRRKRLPIDPNRYRRWTGKRSRTSGFRSPNGDVCSLASSSRRSEASRVRPDLVLVGSERASVVSGGSVVMPHVGATVQLSPQQLGVMGMEALETAVRYWEDSLAAYSGDGGGGGGGAAVLLSSDEAALCSDLQTLLDAVYALQDQCELLFLDQQSVLFRPGDQQTLNGGSAGGDGRSPSGADSFASAVDQVADLRDFDDAVAMPMMMTTMMTSGHVNGTTASDEPALYESALRQLEGEAGIPCRTLRTDLVRCGSDSEYLAKLHCIRLAFHHILTTKDHRGGPGGIGVGGGDAWNWFADAGRQTLADLLLYADRDPKDFLVGYEAMLAYVRDPANRPELEEELAARGVRALTFYDVVMDYILMDAFEDLDSPPASVTAVVQNRWLSDGFKETALTTAVWSVLKAKRRMLRQHPAGFMAHFYVISEQLVPLLAWGFLGPDETLRDTCVYFRDQVVALLVDMFSFQRCRFTTVQDLAADIISHLRHRLSNVNQRLCGSI